MKIWIYLNQTQQGPFAPEELVGMPGLTADTLVWFEGLPKWYRAGELQQMQTILDGTYASPATRTEPDTQSTYTEADAHVEDRSAGEGFNESESFNEGENSSHGEDRSEDYSADHSQGRTYGDNYGHSVPDNAEVNVTGQVYYAPEAVVNVGSAPASKCPPSYIGWSVFLLICCCSPVSLAALIASICVSSYYSKGDLASARKASEWAAWLIMIAFALGIIPVMLMSALMK